MFRRLKFTLCSLELKCIGSGKPVVQCTALCVTEEEVKVEYLGGSKYCMSVGGESFEVSGSLVCDNDTRLLSASVGGTVSKSCVVLDERDIHLFTQVGVRSR